MVISTGISVITTIADEIMTNDFVYASGWKSFPSWPVSRNTGRNPTRIINSEKKIALPTCLADNMEMSRYSSLVRCPFLCQRIGNIAIGIFHQHNGRIDNHSNRQDNAPQGHDVGCDAEKIHQNECKQYGYRQFNQNAKDGSEVKEKYRHDNCNDNACLDKSTVNVPIAASINVERS
jgi:hypothetical protein